MPRLPSIVDYQADTPRPTRGVTAISPTTERPDLATGRAMQEIGLAMQHEAEKIDEVLALDAMNQLQEKHIELTYGDNGFTKLQGKAVTERPIVQEYPGQAKLFAEGLAAKISSPGAKQKFMAAAARMNSDLQVKVAVHSAKQVELIEEQAFIGAQAQAMTMAKNGDLVGAERYFAPVLGAAIGRKGLQGDAAALFSKEAMGAVYASGIESYIVAGQSQAARELFNISKTAMTEAQVAKFDKLIEEQTSYDKAGELADRARAEGLTEAQAYDLFRKEAKGDKATAETAKGIFEQYRAMQDRDDAKTLAPLQLNFLELGGGFAAQGKIIKSPEYVNAPERVRVQIRDYMTGHARAMQSFGRSEEAYWENKKATDPSVLVAFGNIAGSPETLVLYDDAQLQVAMLPVLGKQRTADLIRYKHQVAGEAQKFKIPKDIIDQAMPPTLQKAKTGVQQQQKDRFEGLVTEGLMDWKLANPGKHPDKQQQQEIVAGAARKISTPGAFFGLGTSEYNAYEFKPIAADFVEAAQTDALLKKGRKLTQTELQNLWALQKDAKIK